MITLDSIPAPNPEAVGHVVDGQAVVVVPANGDVKVFNEVGTYIWGLVNGKRSVRKIADQVCQEFDVDADTAQKDTLEFITDIIQQDIVMMGTE